MGFWAYLTLNFIAGSTLPRRVWRWAQMLILAVVLYDMFWSRYHIDAARHPLHHAGYGTFLIQALWPLLAALAAAAGNATLASPSADRVAAVAPAASVASGRRRRQRSESQIDSESFSTSKGSGGTPTDRPEADADPPAPPR